MKAERILNVVAEMIDENPFALRAVLRILRVEFTDEVRTLAVTCEDKPRLRVNLDFVAANCANESEVKALLCHEFLHVLLRHTEERVPYSLAHHLALDAVINAIIHREHGSAYTSLMSRFYANQRGIGKLLRPMNEKELARWDDRHSYTHPVQPWVEAWAALYEGRLVVDDIEALAEEFTAESLWRGVASVKRGPFTLGRKPPDRGSLLGSHDDVERPLPEALRDAVEQSLREMNGSGIWRSPHGAGVGADAYEALMRAGEAPLGQWQRRTLALLRQHLLPDPRSRAMNDVPHDYRLPVLSPRDRRAFMRAQWSPFLPESAWEGRDRRREGTAQVYLDVSGSMHAEMPLVIALLARVSKWIRRPFWAFSNVVAPAVIEQGQLKARTTGGTSMACVLEHVAQTAPPAAVVLTDGYIEKLDRAAVMRALARTRFTALVTRDGSPALLRQAGIPYTQLDKVPA